MHRLLALHMYDMRVVNDPVDDGLGEVLAPNPPMRIGSARSVTPPFARSRCFEYLAGFAAVCGLEQPVVDDE